MTEATTENLKTNVTSKRGRWIFRGSVLGVTLLIINYFFIAPDFKGREWLDVNTKPPRMIAETDTEYFFRVLKGQTTYSLKMIRGELWVHLFKAHYEFQDEDSFDIYDPVNKFSGDERNRLNKQTLRKTLKQKGYDPSKIRDINQEYLALPNFLGNGDLPFLHASMYDDPVLKQYVEDFAARDSYDIFLNYDQTNQDIERILFRWAGVDNIDPDSRGWFINARALRFTEKFLANPFHQIKYYHNPMPYGAYGLKGTWEAMFRTIKANLIIQILIKNKVITLVPSSNYHTKFEVKISSDFLGVLAKRAQSMPRTERRNVYKYVSDVALLVNHHHKVFAPAMYVFMKDPEVFKKDPERIIIQKNLQEFMETLFPEISAQ